MDIANILLRYCKSSGPMDSTDIQTNIMFDNAKNVNMALNWLIEQSFYGNKINNIASGYVSLVIDFLWYLIVSTEILCWTNYIVVIFIFDKKQKQINNFQGLIAKNSICTNISFYIFFSCQQAVIKQFLFLLELFEWLLDIFYSVLCCIVMFLFCVSRFLLRKTKDISIENTIFLSSKQ